jgi:protein phosphatase
VLIDSGVSPEETRHAKKILMNALGGRTVSVVPDIVHLALEHADRLLLCSDGLTRHVSDPEIAEVLGSKLLPQVACDTLVKIALDRGGKDNVTVVLADASRSVFDRKGKIQCPEMKGRPR